MIEHEFGDLALRFEAADAIFRALARSGQTAGLNKELAIKHANRAAAASTGVDVLAELGIGTSGARAATRSRVRADGVPEFTAAWRGGKLPVPFTVCRTSELYGCYRKWCIEHGVHDHVLQTHFLGCVVAADPSLERRSVTVDGKTTRLIFPSAVRRQAADGEWTSIAQREATKFHAAWMEWQGHEGRRHPSTVGGRG